MIGAVLFDWRGTLVTTLTERDWVEQALLALDRDRSPGAVDGVVSAIAVANGDQNRLDGPGVDSDAALHRRTYLGVFADAGLDAELAEALYQSSEPEASLLLEDDVRQAEAEAAPAAPAEADAPQSPTP